MRPDDRPIELYHRTSLPTVRDILAVLFRQRWPLLIVFCIILVVVAISGLWIPTYESQMKILVRRQRSDAIVTSSVTSPTQLFNDQVSEEDLNSEVELLSSEDLLRKVVLATGLGGVSGPPIDKAGEVQMAKAVRSLGKTLKIDAVRKSNVISVRYPAHDPELAARVLQALSKAYIDKHLEVHRSSGESKFFDQRLDEYQQGLDQAHAKLTAFTKETGVVSADQERDSALREANEFDATAHQAQSALIETEHRISVLQAQLRSIQPRMTTIVRTSDNPQLLEQLKSTLLNLELKRTELLTKFEPTYRAVREVELQIAETQSSISAEESKPIRDETSDQNPDYEWVRGELTKAQADLSGLKARADSAAENASHYHQIAQRLDQDGLVQQDLERAAKTQEENYLLYSHKREEARISDALDQSHILNVAMAEQPLVPALPTKSPLAMAFLTIILAGTFSVSTAFVVDFMNLSFRTPGEVVNYLGTPVLAALPKGER